MTKNAYKTVSIIGLAAILLITAYALYRQRLGDYPINQPGGYPEATGTVPTGGVQADAASLDSVRSLVTNFGQKLKNVSLLAPLADVKKSINDNYKEYLSADLLNRWLAGTSTVLGRQVSSPWPDRIEISSIVPVTADQYQVQGDIVERTSAEATGTDAGRVPINLIVERSGSGWVITSASSTPEAGVSGWQTFTDKSGKISYQYPASFPAQYISTQVWPPLISLKPGELKCPSSATSGPGKAYQQKTIVGRTYCVETQSEGAAGSIYTDYTYLTALGGQVATINFTLRYPQCLNYEDPKQTECSTERAAFNLDALVDKIVSTVKTQ